MLYWKKEKSVTVNNKNMKEDPEEVIQKQVDTSLGRLILGSVNISQTKSVVFSLCYQL